MLLPNRSGLQTNDDQQHPTGSLRTRRILIILSALSLVLCLALVAFWVRSYHSADRLHGRVWGKRSFIVASKQGRVTVVGFLWHGAPNWWTWELRSHPADDVMSFPVGDVCQYEKGLGFGTISQPLYLVMNPTQQTAQGVTMILSGAATAALRGAGVIMPYWFLVLISATLSTVLAINRTWRFSMRSLFVAITLLAVVLALVGALGD